MCPEDSQVSESCLMEIFHILAKEMGSINPIIRRYYPALLYPVRWKSYPALDIKHGTHPEYLVHETNYSIESIKSRIPTVSYPMDKFCFITLKPEFCNVN